MDTGANLSTISESYAQKLGMSIREASVEVNTATGMKLRTRMAVADKFDVGGLEFENVVFLVLPDDQLAFEEVGYSIKGIVGFPIIHQMRELRIGREHITIPSKPTPSHLGNLCLEGLMPVIKARARDEELIFTFDTGATRSELSRRYFDRHRQWIESEGELLTARRGGGGGMVDAENYFIDDFTLEIGTAEVTLPQIGVSLENYLFNEDKDGNMGQDVFMRFDETVICFEYMYVDLMNYENGSRDGEAGKTGMEQETLSEPSDIIDNSVCG